jgi:hypothetical protein
VSTVGYTSEATNAELGLVPAVADKHDGTPTRWADPATANHWRRVVVSLSHRVARLDHRLHWRQSDRGELAAICAFAGP